MTDRTHLPDDEGRGIATVLDELASTMSDHPDLLDAVQNKIDQRHRRHTMVRAGAAAAACSLVVAGLVAINRPANNSSRKVGVAAALAADCAGVPHGTPLFADPGATKAANAIESSAGAEGGAPPPDKAVIEEQVTPAKGQPPAEGATVTVVKFEGLVTTRPDAGHVTVQVPEPQDLAGSVSVALTADTQYQKLTSDTEYTKDVVASSETAVVAGAAVGIVARDDGSGYVAEWVTILDGLDSPSSEAAAAPGAQPERRAKAVATVADRNGDAVKLTAMIGDEEQAAISADLSTVHAIHADGRPCVAVDLAPGQDVGVVVGQAGDAPWVVTTLLFP